MKINSVDPDVESLVRRINDKLIDLQPDFQRDLVWSKKKQQCLVDTILREWKFPPIYLVSEEGSAFMEVLDGQQRLQAIVSFVNNEFPVDGAIEPADQKIAGLGGLLFKDLPSLTQNRFLRYSIRVHELCEYTSEEPYELFFRLNQGSTLTPAERRNTLYGEFRNQVRTLVAYMEGDFSVDASVIGFNNSRLSYQDVVSRLLYAVSTGSIERKITDADLIAMYRGQSGADDCHYQRTKAAIALFFTGLAGKVRLNKATLLTWLLFFAYELKPIPDLVNSFESEREDYKKEQLYIGSSNLISDILSVYQERSSSSVNDAVPVQLRLLCIYLYALERDFHLSSDRARKAYSIRESLNHIDRGRLSERHLIGELERVRWGAA